MENAVVDELARASIEEAQTSEMAMSEQDYADMFKDMKKKKKKSAKKASAENEEGHVAAAEDESNELDKKSQVEQENDATYAKARLYWLIESWYLILTVFSIYSC